MKKSRILSLTLAFVLVFVSAVALFPGMGAMASTIELGDKDYENSANVLKVICPEFPLSNGEKTTRAEFVAAVTMALNMPASASAKSNFTDVPSTHMYASRIAYAASMELISNVALFYPDTPVTYAQAIKIVMSAAGYGKKAEYTGGYPTGYLKAANEAGVGKGLNLDSDDVISHEVASRLIFEACVIDMMEATSFGSSFEYTLTEGKNILSVYHKIYMAEGIVEANSHSGLYGASSTASDDCIEISGISFYGKNYESTLGKRARVYYRDDNKNSIVTAYELENQAYTYTSDDTVTLSDFTVTASALDDVKDKKYSLEGDYAVIYNGKALAARDITPYFNVKSGTITLIDNDDNGKIDVIIINDISYGIIGSINVFEGKIYDQYQKNGLIDLGKSDVKYSIKAESGEDVSIETLEAGDKIGYTVSADGNLYEITKYTSKVGGRYEMLNSEGDITVKGKEYALSDYYTENVKDVENIKLNTEVILHLGFNGHVIYVEEFASTVHYAFLVAVGKENGLDATAKLKLYTDEGKMLETEVAPKVKIDGSQKTSASEILSILEDLEQKAYAYRVIKYTQDVEGKVNKILTATDNVNGTNMLYSQGITEARPVIYYDSTKVTGPISDDPSVVVPYEIEKTKCPFHSRGAFTPYFHAGSGSKIMQIPVRPAQFSDEENYRIISSAPDNYLRTVAYDVAHGGIASFVLISNDSSAGSIGKYDGSAIIESISEGANEDGEKLTILKLYYGGEWNKYYYEEGFTKITAEKTGGDGTQPQTELTIKDFAPGDIIRIAADSDRLIAEMTMNFDVSKREVVSTMTQTTTNNNGRYVEYIKGYALSYASSRLVLDTTHSIDEIDALGGVVDIESTYSGTLTRGTNLYVRFHRNRHTGAIESAEVYKEENNNSLETYFNSGRNADYVVLRQYFRDPSLNVFYVNIDG